MPTVEEVSLAAFTGHLKALKGSLGTFESYKADKAGFDTVIAALEGALEFAAFAEYKYFVALEGSKCIAVLLMQKDGGRFLINDLVSLGGGGRLLAEAGVAAARKALPNSEISLVSETEKSTTFWLAMGFVSANAAAKRSVGMSLPQGKDLTKKGASKHAKE